MNKPQAVICQQAPFLVQGAQWDDRKQCWQAGHQGASVEVIIPHGARWLALQGQLEVLEGDYHPRLMFCCEETPVYFPVPVTLKGTIQEVVPVPAGASKALFFPMQGAGEFRLQQWQLTAISVSKAYWRMVRRVALYLCRHGLKRSGHIGLTAGMCLFHPAQAYRLVGEQRAYAPALQYPEWLQRFGSTGAEEQAKIGLMATRLAKQYRPAVVIYGDNQVTQSEWQQSIQSVRKLLAPACPVTMLVQEQASGSSDAWLDELATEFGVNVFWRGATAELLPSADWFLVLRAGAQLSSDALCWLMAATDRSPHYKAWYSDHDRMLSYGRSDPQFKPDWSLELERASHYVGDMLWLQRDLLMQSGWVGAAESGYGLCLRVAEHASVLGHVPAVLWHQPVSQADALPHRLELEQHLLRAEVAATVKAGLYNSWRVEYHCPQPLPLVSLIVPTRDMLSHLQPCIDSVLEHTRYANFELIIVDNQSREAETLAYLQLISQDPRVRVLRYDQVFNYSAINNFAAEHARGSVIGLLNNDTEVISADWLTVMVGQLFQSGVGVVGAKLLFSDRKVQHAGDVVGPGGCADHLHSRLDEDAPGYMKRAVLAQDLSAVTAACLLTHKSLFNRLGGLNATDLKVAFNDVDYCLRVRAAGWRVIFTPYAKLYHHESVSRGADDNPEKQKRAKAEVSYMQSRWADVIQADPFYNPNLSYARPDFKLSAAPRVEKPWRA